jgi:hypothetical protein
MVLAMTMLTAAAPHQGIVPLGEIQPGNRLLFQDDNDIVLIYSPGGETDAAFVMAEQVKDKTCVVVGAGSAALMIVLPACKERFYIEGAFLQFHSANIMFDRMVGLNQWDMEQFAAELKVLNNRILNHMLEKGVPFSEDFLKKAMREDTFIPHGGLRHWHPWLRPVSECLHCPTWVVMLRRE